ncbi:MAG: FKBP-type peptidyl-prolyl cis-trans isomerase [Flavobacteriales bacterium]
MKKILILTIAGVATLASCNNDKANEPAVFAGLESTNDSLSYYLGTEVAPSFMQSNIHKVYEPTAFAKGLTDGFAKAEYLIQAKDIEPQLRAKFMALYQDTAKFDFVGKSAQSFEALNTIDDTINYYIGTDVSSRLEKNGFKSIFQQEAYLQGINDIMSGLPVKVNKDAMTIKAKALVDAQSKVLAKEGTEFLNAKSAEENVITLPSGLRYKVITEGTGAKPTATDRVKAHYHGTLMDGTIFDSSVDRGEPLEIGVGQVIPGWTEALQLMPVGSKWELYIPYNLAYGERGSQSIPPYSPLVFQVELLDIVAMSDVTQAPQR